MWLLLLVLYKLVELILNRVHLCWNLILISVFRLLMWMECIVLSGLAFMHFISHFNVNLLVNTLLHARLVDLWFTVCSAMGSMHKFWDRCVLLVNINVLFDGLLNRCLNFLTSKDFKVWRLRLNCGSIGWLLHHLVLCLRLIALDVVVLTRVFYWYPPGLHPSFFFHLSLQSFLPQGPWHYVLWNCILLFRNLWLAVISLEAFAAASTYCFDVSVSLDGVDVFIFFFLLDVFHVAAGEAVLVLLAVLGVRGVLRLQLETARWIFKELVLFSLVHLPLFWTFCSGWLAKEELRWALNRFWDVFLFLVIM